MFFAACMQPAPVPPSPSDMTLADFYLIDPPPNALHRAIPPSRIVFAGDSAGGGLALTTLTVIRDLGLPLPAVRSPYQPMGGFDAIALQKCHE
jgi:hypothetical protein